MPPVPFVMQVVYHLFQYVLGIHVAMVPMFLYEIGLGLCLLVKGVNVQRSAA